MEDKALALATLWAPRIAGQIDYDLPEDVVINHLKTAIHGAMINLAMVEDFRISGAMRCEVTTQYELGRIL